MSRRPTPAERRAHDEAMKPRRERSEPAPKTVKVPATRGPQLGRGR